jgi:hypothetical protein
MDTADIGFATFVILTAPVMASNLNDLSSE